MPTWQVVPSVLRNILVLIRNILYICPIYIALLRVFTGAFRSPVAQSIFFWTLNWNCNYYHAIQRIFEGIRKICFLSLIRRIKQKHESVRKSPLSMDRTFISCSQVWVTIHIITLLQCVRQWKQTLQAVLSLWEAEAVLGDRLQSHGGEVRILPEIMKPFSLAPLPCSIGNISLKKSGQLLNSMRGQSVKLWGHVSERLLGFVHHLGKVHRDVHPWGCRHIQGFDGNDSWYLFA